MKLETFFEKFDQFADAPGAVEKMRELILHLAVSGRLLGDQKLFFIHDENYRFSLPEYWDWITLGETLSIMKNGFSGKASKEPDQFFLTRIETIATGNVDLNRVGYLSEFSDRDQEKHKILDGDILLSHINSVVHLGKTALVRNPPQNLFHGVNLLLLRPKSGVLGDFLHLALKELRVSGYFQSKAKRAINQASINQKTLNKTPIPLPPLAEQKWIVAKVDELMALCDQLETQQQERDAQASQLARATLARFAAAPTPAKLKLLFNPLPNSPFFTPHSHFISPADLRKSILTLAVQGKLVPQDSSDLTAEELTVGDHVAFQNGYAFKSGWFKKSGIKLCRNTNVSHGILDWYESKFVDQEVAEEFKRFSLSEGDIVLSLDRPLIKTGLKIARITQNDLPCLLLQRVARPVPKTDKLDPSYLYMWLTSPAFVDTIDPGRSNGVPHISTRQVQALPFTLPAIDQQHRIVAKVDQLMPLVDELETQLTNSHSTAKNLLEALVAELTKQS